tara:strand:+ start:3566 stop:4045 length:480 start_codon:yes stop_codon:yes gene_type:complete
MELDKKVRDFIEKKISKFFKKKISKKIEGSIFRFSVEYATDNETPFLLEQIYNTKSDEILQQFKKSESLIKKIKENEYNPDDLAFLKVEQLHPEKYEKILKKRQLEEAKKKNKATTNAFRCSKCGERKTTIVEKQTRAGDEPATVYITCSVCGNKWTMN